MSNCCSSAPKLIFACSGAADVGEIADNTARKLTADGAGKMFCLAGIGGNVSGIVASTEAASAILAIDGCSVNCTKKTLEQAGFTNFSHIILTDLGLVKGQTPVTIEVIEKVANKSKDILNANSHKIEA